MLTTVRHGIDVLASDEMSPSEEFKAAVLHDFAFLSSVGFDVRDTEPMIIRFVSNLYFLNVYWDSRTYEIGVEVGSASDLSRSIGSISALISVFDWDAGANRPIMPPAPTVKEMKKIVLSLADDIRQHVDLKALLSPGLDARISANAKKIFDSRWPTTSFDDFRARLPELWKQGRYNDIVNLFEVARRFLSEDELKMLDLAKERIRGIAH